MKCLRVGRILLALMLLGWTAAPTWSYRPAPLTPDRIALAKVVAKTYRMTLRKNGLVYVRRVRRPPWAVRRARRYGKRSAVEFRNVSDSDFRTVPLRYRLIIDGRRTKPVPGPIRGTQPSFHLARLRVGPHWVRLSVMEGAGGRAKLVYSGHVLVTGASWTSVILRDCKTVATCRAVVVQDGKTIFGRQ